MRTAYLEEKRWRPVVQAFIGEMICEDWFYRGEVTVDDGWL